MPADVIASAYKKFVAPNNPSSVQAAHKGGKGKGKGKGRMTDRQNIKGRWVNLYPAPEEINHDLLMLPHPDLVNRDDETFVIIGHNLKVRVTKENWNTLRFITKSSNPEYFPPSYLRPVPTVLSETGDAGTASFPRSTINGTVEDFRALLLAPVISKNTKVSPDVYRGLSLGGSSGAELPSDKATAEKRIWAFLKLCAKFIPCEHEAYDLAVACLDAEVDADLPKALTVLKTTQERFLPVIVKAQIARGGLCAPPGTVLPTSRKCSVPQWRLRGPRARRPWSQRFPQEGYASGQR